MISIFKKITLANRVIEAYKYVKKTSENGAFSKAKEVKKALDDIKAGFDVLLGLLPWLKNLYNEVKEVLKSAK